MKGKPKIIQMLNDRLAEELTAISLYMVHSEMCANWGFEKLHEAFREAGHRRDEARRDAHRPDPVPRRFADRVEAEPDEDRRNVTDMIIARRGRRVRRHQGLQRDHCGSRQAGDNGTRELIAKILLDEERHVDWAETQRELIAQMGLQNYLANQA